MTNRQILLFHIITLACACSDGLTGRYEDASGITHYQFEEDGRVVISMLGTTVIAEYKLDDNKIFLTSPQGTVVLTRNGRLLYGPMGLELVRQDQ